MKLFALFDFDFPELYSLSFYLRYQFNPDLFNPDVVVNILVKALASVPFPDFNLSVALLDDKASSANMDEPDPLPNLLPYLTNLHSLLQQCRFPAFWALYRSDALEPLRDNYTVEVVGFEDSIREVAVRAVKATFQNIGSKRLGSYLDLEGNHLCHMLSSVKLINPDRIDCRTRGYQTTAYVPASFSRPPYSHLATELTKVISHAIPAV